MTEADRKEVTVNHYRKIQAARYAYIIFSIGLCLFGGILLLRNGPQLQKMTTGTGILLILFGSCKIWGYYSKDLYRLAFQHGLATGIFAAAIDLYVLTAGELPADLLCTILGLTILMDALTKIEMSLDAKAFGISAWWLILFTGILNGILSFLLIPHPWDVEAKMIMILGAALLTEGILNILTAVITIQLPTKIHPEEAASREDSPWGL